MFHDVLLFIGFDLEIILIIFLLAFIFSLFIVIIMNAIDDDFIGKRKINVAYSQTYAQESFEQKREHDYNCYHEGYSGEEEER